ncbi:LysR family transcriptional regulator [uncultured Sphingosinicella sp.]|uniref:helix-turn-helix domain-containing protein n=1 Tax=uncultured Sphingosinicella sp. TaxID=478748 RepID=UPI0030DD6F45
MDGSSDSILSALDLNHLRILDTMLRGLSVRQTAEHFCVTPSAISHALAKLDATSPTKSPTVP